MEYILKQLGPQVENTNPIIIRLDSRWKEIGRIAIPELQMYSQVSRRHAKVSKINGEWFIEDLNSINGLYVNGIRIDGRRKLDIGDVIGFGITDFIHEGFICTFISRRVVKSEPIEIVDLIDDEPRDTVLDPSVSSLTSNESTLTYNVSDPVNVIENRIKQQEITPDINESETVDCQSSEELIINNVKNSRNASKESLQQTKKSHFTRLSLYNSALSANEVINDTKCLPSHSNSSLISIASNPSTSNKSSVISNSTTQIPQKQTARKSFSVSNSVSSDYASNYVIKLKGKESFSSPNEKLHFSKFTSQSKKYVSKNVFKELIKDCSIRLNRCDSANLKLQAQINISKEDKYNSSQKRVGSGSHNKTVSKKVCINSDIEGSTEILSESNQGTFKKVSFHSSPMVVDFSSRNIQNSLLNPKTTVTSSLLNETVKEREELNYSQVEEVICISDDDSYLDFNSSQPIKQEPLDEDDLDYSSFNELPDENDVIPIDDSNVNYESIENISKYIEMENILPNIKREKITPERDKNQDPSYLQSTSSDSTFLASDNFLDDAQSNDSEISEHSDVMYPSFGILSKDKNYPLKKKPSVTDVNLKVNEYLKHKPRISIGKTLLTEPKPMERRPRKMRGREEWFEPKEISESTSLSESKESKLQSNETIKKSLESKLQRNISSRSSEKYSKLNSHSRVSAANNKSMNLNFKKKMPIKNSDIFQTSYTSYLEKKEKLKLIEYKKASQMKETTGLPLPKKNAPTVKKRSENFGSRSQFLTSIPDEEMNRKNRLKAQTKYVQNNKPTNGKLSKSSTHSKSSDKKSTTSFQKSALLHSITDLTKMKSVPNPTVSENTFSTSNQSKNGDLDKSKNQNLPSVLMSHQNRPSSKELDPRLNKNSNESKNTHKHAIPRNSEKHVSETIDQRKKFEPVAVEHSFSKSKSYIPKYSSIISFNKMLEKIVNLNVKWITEQERVNRPPPEIHDDAIDLPLHFNSYESYVSAFTPMLMLEFWDELVKYAGPIIKNNVLNKFYFTILNSSFRENLTEYECESLVNKNSAAPIEGTVVILEIKTEENRRHPILGYVNFYKVNEDLSLQTAGSVWNRVQKNWIEGAKHWKFTVLAKQRPITPVLNDIMKGNVIFSVKNRLRLADGLKNLKNSPLCNSILKPEIGTFLIREKLVNSCVDFSPIQKTIIEGINAEFKTSKNNPKIILLQGPPGTGKTRTIVGLIERLIFTNGNLKVKILVTAPSNAAIDEIGCRLIDLNERVSWSKKDIKFVRIGLDKSMSGKMKQYSLDEKAEERYRDDIRRSDWHTNQVLSKKEEEIKGLKAEYEKYPSYSKKQTIEALISECKQIREEMFAKRNKYGKIREIKRTILAESHVVLSTLGSCCQSLLISAYHSDSLTFSCCIVDEATQCTEPEILQPLAFGIKKLILVGDHNQLPATINSQFALRKGFDRSLFERFHLYFSRFDRQSPILMLIEQFRMHSEICMFPSRFFYDGKLITVPDNDIRCAQFPLIPYIVYDLLDSQESNSLSSKTNCNEARAIASICSELIRFDSSASVGIITPYQAQVKLYRDALYQNPGYRNIEINTVDSFQGREKDIIIVSCVRANSASGSIGFLSCRKRLNVAITRARQCLIICVHSSTLESSNYWRELINDARQRNLLIKVPSCRDISRIFIQTMRKKQ